MKQYICTRGWQRNSKDDIIDEWQYNKYPEEVKERNFKVYEPEPVKPVKKEVVEKVEKQVPVVSPKMEQTTTRFKPFNLEDDVKL